MSEALIPVYQRLPLEFEKGKGAWLFTKEGDAYLDFASGIAVNTLGHQNPVLVEALKVQAEKLWHVSNLYQIEEQNNLAHMLKKLSFADGVFFCNSGTEAMEAALKMARRYHYHKGDKQKYEIIAFQGAFHGRSFGSLAASGNPMHLEGFGPVLEGFSYCKEFTIEAVENLTSDRTAAIIIEPIQGEGGIRVISHDFLSQLRKLCDEKDILLIFDEVQCGIGRTGKLFAHEWAKIYPDIMTLAKGLGGGFPIGAVLAKQQAFAAMNAGTHGSTFGGNPLAMAVSHAVIQVVSEPEFLQQVCDISMQLQQKLIMLIEEMPHIFSTLSGKGLMLGLECVIPNQEVFFALQNEQLLTVKAARNMIRLLPPLNIATDEIDKALSLIRNACKNLS